MQEYKIEEDKTPYDIEERPTFERHWIVREGGISEFPFFHIEKNGGVKEYEHTCRHTKDGVHPYLICAHNEGGYNGTAVCLLCILEAIKQLGLET